MSKLFMRYKILIIFVLFIYQVNSQNKIGGKITFAHRIVKMGIDTAAVANNHVKSVIVSQMKRSKRALEKTNELYQLTFNSHESLFETFDFLDNDYDPVLSRFISKMKYYQNLSECIRLEQIPIFGSTYLVNKEPIEYNWELKKKRKNITGYNCRLAVSSLNKKSKLQVVQAWYTTDIPVSFGPKGYNGLPGMILAVKELGSFYYAVNVDFKETINIEKPTKGKKVSEKAFKQLVDASMKRMIGE